MPATPRTALTLALAAALLLALSGPLGAASSEAPQPRRSASRATALPPLSPVPGEVIVRFRADAATLRAHAMAGNAKAETVAVVLAKRAAALGERVGRALEAGEAVGEPIQVVRERGAHAAELARRLAADAEVEWAEPNGRQRRLQVPPNDPLYPLASRQPNGPDAGQWYLRRPDSTIRSSIDAEAAWARGFGSPSVVVAVLDTGVRFEHPDLGRVTAGGRLLHGYDFVSDATVANDGSGRDADPSDPGDWVTSGDKSSSTFGDCDVADSSWHGTATASIVAAASNNGIGMAGTAPGVRVLPVRVLGKCFGRDSDIQAAMRWAAGIHVDGVPDNPNPAKVINMSLGSSSACSASYQNVVNEIVARGVVVVAAAGNSAGGPVGTPASCTGVIAVAALRHAGTKVGFSDLGPQITISAPGGNCVNVDANAPCLYPIVAAIDSGLTSPVASTWSDSFDTTLGTSFAAPQVAGTVALMLTQQPSLTPALVKTALQNTARPFPTTGADAGAGNPPVVNCVPPSNGTQQLQCYCPNAGSASYPLCGAGMLDAGAAVMAVAATYASIESTPHLTAVGDMLTFDGRKSMAAPGRAIQGWAWSIVDGGGVAAAFTGATSGPTAQLTATGRGTIVVRLTVIDDAVPSSSASTTLAVPVPSPVPSEEPAAINIGDRKGGGAWSPGWLLALALAVLALARGAQTRGS